jgi:single-stranded-DNA-specific exonuclease
MILRKILSKAEVEVDQRLSHLSAKIQQLLASRKIQSPDDLDYGINGLLPPSGLKNIQQATEFLYEAILAKQSILIIGDFDADGATSTSIMMKALNWFGVLNVDFLVPDRFKFGYGLSVKLVEHAASLKPDLIVTVDNGIANVEGVAKANEFGIKVIITDHHLPADKVPAALSIVNPNQHGDEFESKNLAGVGVAFYLMLSLRALMRDKNWFSNNQIEEPNLASLLDIVALGTVADVVVLDKNNRILVEQGLRRIRSGLACPGIKALLRIAKRDESKCQASDLGFAIGPRINAAGRLDDMTIGIDCLLAENIDQAMIIATKLDNLNRSRRSIEQDMLIQANLDITAYLEKSLGKQGLSSLSSESVSRPISLCLFDPDWHQGVIGILASRVKDKINRPVIVFAMGDESTNENGENFFAIKGSCRSVKGVHIRDVLALVDSQHPHLIEKFGGHAMAAGLSIKQDDFRRFAEAFHDAVEIHLNGSLISDEIITDGSLSPQDLGLNFAHQIRALGPWGQGFTEPLFDDEFSVVTSRIVGEDHLKLVIEKDGHNIDGIYFRCPEQQRAKAGDKVQLVYKLDINEFRGKETAQIMIEQLEIIS